jgi:hypothetical protein
MSVSTQKQNTEIPKLGLRVTDPETARVVAIHRANGEIVGAGCLLDDAHILTCRHVVAAALHPQAADENARLYVTLAGVITQPTVSAIVSKLGDDRPENDLALLVIIDGPKLIVPEVEFASPLRHGGKMYSVLGFPGGDQQGRNARGYLFAADARGLVQMDRGGALSVLGGFSGAPVWSPDLSAFVGLVVTELSHSGVSWCIPSRRLCEFYNNLPVRFRIPPTDRPVIHDYVLDDPNVDLFGTLQDNGERRLTAEISPRGKGYTVFVRYECLRNSKPPRGRLVTFITYPGFGRQGEDAYELFARINGGIAEQEFYPGSLFTVAAIGDGGDTALTLDLEALECSSRTKRKRSQGGYSEEQENE